MISLHIPFTAGISGLQPMWGALGTVYGDSNLLKGISMVSLAVQGIEPTNFGTSG